jgi:glycosyltransferase involved in cell wall biosynthesis
MSKKNQITIIVPAYNEEDNLPTFLDETKKVTNNLEGYILEFIFIDDESEDFTWAVNSVLVKRSQLEVIVIVFLSS